LFILLPLAYFNGFIRISDLTSEQESIAKKYGGVYVFDEKLEKEIDKREEERRIMTKGLSGKKLAENRYAVDMTPVNEKLPRVCLMERDTTSDGLIIKTKLVKK